MSHLPFESQLKVDLHPRPIAEEGSSNSGMMRTYLTPLDSILCINALCFSNIILQISEDGRMGVSPPHPSDGATSQKNNKCVGGCGVCALAFNNCVERERILYIV